MNHLFIVLKNLKINFSFYALLGYRKSTILYLLAAENLLSCFGAFVTGIFLGGLFHKGIVFGITKVLVSPMWYRQARKTRKDSIRK